LLGTRQGNDTENAIEIMVFYPLGYGLDALVLAVCFLPPAVLWAIKVDPTLVTLLSLKSFQHKNCLHGRLCFFAVLFHRSIGSGFGSMVGTFQIL